MLPRHKLMQDPSAVFEKPGDVLDNMELSTEQKIEVLRQWQNDVQQRLVAEMQAVGIAWSDEEWMRMPGSSKNSTRLQEISDALIKLENG